METLKVECDRLGAEIGIPSSLIAPRASLEAIARHRPQRLDDIKVSGALMQWQCDLLAPRILPALQASS